MNEVGLVFRRSPWVLILVMLAASGCAEEPPTLFRQLAPERTGITFANTIVEDDTLYTPLSFDYVYNGGGVAVGDVDGDGRPDIYFAGNQVPSRLYLNRGDLHFDDVTTTAGVAAPDTWSTGVAMADVNQDGWLDIYVSAGGPVEAAQRANRLYVNRGTNADGVPVFEEAAEAYGLADTGYSTQAAFFDYDRDGDLDVYLLTNANDDAYRNRVRPKWTNGEAPSTDRLYRNGGPASDDPAAPHRFTDVSAEAGILVEGYGLGIVVTDINRDGWPDVYCANDFVTNDLLYVNNGDGTFTNRAGDYMTRQAHNGMGADAADINNDGLVDVAVLDMLPPDNRRQKLMTSIFTYDTFHMALGMGYEPQYMRNMLQLNNGLSPDGHLTFSEIGQLAGIYNTDWSWSPLFADFDNDGLKDLLITNGYGKDVTNLDYVVYGEQSTMFGTREAKRRKALEAINELPEVRLRNYLFQNAGDLTFVDRTAAWGSGPPSISNGAAFGDLDGDGDLDLVTNNINDAAFVLENTTRTSEEGASAAANHFLRVVLQGPAGNRAGFGTKLTIRAGGRQQYHDHTPFRGYQSSVEHVVHFGLGASQRVDSLEVEWPDGRYQLLTDVSADQVVEVRHADAARRDAPDAQLPLLAGPAAERPTLFRAVASERGLEHEHVEQTVADFKQMPLLPHKYSENGPGLAVGDVNGDGLDDVFVGADRQQQRFLFVQRPSGQFERQPLAMDTHFEDMGALFFDADGDGDQDLYVVSGGNVAPAGHRLYQDRLYLNDGRGHLEHVEDALPAVLASGSTVTAADYDGDGDLDLFVGGRVVPGEYPLPARSYLLRNDTRDRTVRFTDVTDTVAPDAVRPGLVTDALWTDFNADGQVDLAVVGEWMPIMLLEQRDGRFANVTEESGLTGTAGWWNSLTAGDFDADGDVDYVAGNLGLNTKYRAAPGQPVRVYAKDYDDNGDLDPVLTRYIQGTEHPSHGRSVLIKQMVGMQRRFPTFSAYAEASFDDVLSEREREGAYVAEATHFASSFVENRGDGTFTVRPLPIRAQVAPIYGMLPGDYDGDGHLDLLYVGNSYAPDVQTGRADASVGGLLLGDGTGGFTFAGYGVTGFFVDGNARGLASVITADGQQLVLAARHGGPLEVVQWTREPSSSVRLQPLDQTAWLTTDDGATRVEELYYGASYLTQSSRVLRIPREVRSVHIADSRGAERTLHLDEERLAAQAP